MLAGIGIPALCVLGWLGTWWWYVPVVVVAIVALGEYYSACYLKGWRPYALVGYAWTLLLLYPALFLPERAWVLAGPLLIAASLTTAVVGLLPPRVSYAASVATTIFGLVWVAVPMGFLLYLRCIDIPARLGHADVWSFSHRMGAVLLVAMPVWASDTGAFLAGRLVGRHKLCPVLSPKKTLEGSLGGLLSTLLGAVLLGWLWLQMPLPHALLLGLTIGVACQLGDLVESAVKRDLGIKDFGTVLGPHGGVLDRFDGMILAMPAAYLYLVAVLPAHASLIGL